MYVSPAPLTSERGRGRREKRGREGFVSPHAEAEMDKEKGERPHSQILLLFSGPLFKKQTIGARGLGVDSGGRGFAHMLIGLE